MGNTEPLLHAQGIAANPVTRSIGELHQVEHLTHAGAGVAAKAGEHFQIGLRTQAGIEGGRFDQCPNTWQIAEQIGQRLTQDRRASRVWSDQPEQQANGGRLPGPIGTDKTSDGSGGDADGEPIDSGALAKMLAQAMRLNGPGDLRAAWSGSRGRSSLGCLKSIRRAGHRYLLALASDLGGRRNHGISWCNRSFLSGEEALSTRCTCREVTYRLVSCHEKQVRAEAVAPASRCHRTAR